jgi:monothiol glutaredoxin
MAVLRKSHNLLEPLMTRPVLNEQQLHPAIRQQVADLHREVIEQVQTAIHTHPVVVVGMHSNPFVRKARKALDAAGVAHEYLVFGGYTSQWRRRNALKMWTGWPTFPMVFVRGVLIGGAAELQQRIASGELKGLLAP